MTDEQAGALRVRKWVIDRDWINERGRLREMVEKWWNDEGGPEIEGAIKAAIAAWPRTRGGKLQWLDESDFALWDELQHCTAGARPEYPIHDEEEAAADAEQPRVMAAEDDAIPF